MADNKEYMTHQESMGTIQISEDVVASIATSACLEVEGVGGLMNANVSDYVTGKKMTAKGIRVEMDGEGIVVKGVDNTIKNIGELASEGMAQTDKKILSLMTEKRCGR
mgnify:CR=1 FL=1